MENTIFLLMTYGADFIYLIKWRNTRVLPLTVFVQEFSCSNLQTKFLQRWPITQEVSKELVPMCKVEVIDRFSPLK